MTLALPGPFSGVPSAGPPRSAPGWIDLKEAARRSGWDEGYCRRRCCDAARCPGGTWQSLGLAVQERPAAGGKARWLVHETADAKLAPVKTVEQLSDDFDLRTLPAKHQAVVLERERMVLELERANAQAVAGGRKKADALAELLARTGAKRSTLLLWRQQYSTAGRRGLVDGRFLAAPRGADPATGPGPFLEEVQRLYLDQRGRSARLCYDRAADVGRAEGWPICSYATAWRFLKKIPRRTVALHRGGEEAYKAAASCNTRDYSSIDSNDVWVGDHHRFDVICQMPDGSRTRPWLTAWLDMRSRMIVGYTIYAHDPNADAILSTFKAGVETHGAPWHVYIDNGKDYDSFCLQGVTKQQRLRRDLAARLKDGGVFGRLGVEVIHARPYCPQAKTIERFFGTVAGRFSQLFETYCGRDTTRKPEDLPEQLKRGKAPAVEDVALAFADWLDADYHSRVHEGDGMDGRAPAAVFAAELKRKRVLPATLLEELALERTPPVQVGRNGVRWQRQGYGRNQPELLKLDGQKVQLGIDHANLSVARVYALDGRWVCNAPANEKLPVLADKQQLREAMADQARERRTHKAYVQARPRLTMSLADRLYEKAAEKRRKAAPPPPAPDGGPSLVPVRSVIEDQVGAIQKDLERFPLRQAAGAESAPLPARFIYTAATNADEEPGAGPSFRELMAHRPPEEF